MKLVHLMMIGIIIVVYSENQLKVTNIVSRWNVEFINIKRGGMYDWTAVMLY
jgi:hypothetical protein